MHKEKRSETKPKHRVK